MTHRNFVLGRGARVVGRNSGFKAKYEPNKPKVALG